MFFYKNLSSEMVNTRTSIRVKKGEATTRSGRARLRKGQEEKQQTSSEVVVSSKVNHYRKTHVNSRGLFNLTEFLTSVNKYLKYFSANVLL